MPTMTPIQINKYNANAVRNKDQCPLDNKCLTSSVIYNAQVTTKYATKNYIGLTEGTFKQRFSQHKATFKHRKYTNGTELSKYIWKLRDNNQEFNIKWTIISRARPYNNISKRCDLCIRETNDHYCKPRQNRKQKIRTDFQVPPRKQVFIYNLIGLFSIKYCLMSA